MHYPLFISKTLKTVGIATLSASLLIVSGCSEDQKESATEAVDMTSDETAAEPAAGEEEGAWDKTKEVSKDAWDKTKEVSKDAWDKTKEVSKETWDKAKDEAAQPAAESDAQTKQIEDR